MYLLMFSVKCIPYHHVVGLLFIRKIVYLFCFVFFVSVYRDYNRAKTTWPRHMARKQVKMSANATQPLLGE